MTLHVWQQAISDENGNVVAGASVEVKIVGTGALALIYEDSSGGATMDNPFDADEDGFARFYALAGVYRITVSSGLDTRIYEEVELGANISGIVTATYSELADQTNGINTSNKRVNKLVMNTTDGRLYRASDVLAVSPWLSMDSRVAIVPGSDTHNVQTAAGSGTVNDFAISPYTRYLDITPTADVTYTGFAATYDGHEVIVTNLHATFLLDIGANNVGSSAANRVRLGGALTLVENGSFRMTYSSGLSRWIGTP